MIKAVIFDCFGVIISDALQVINDELRAKDPDAANRVVELVRASNKGLLDPADSNREIAAILDIELEAYQQRIREGEIKDRRVLDYAKELRSAYKVGMLSNISGSGLKKRFSEAEIKDCFDVIVASGDIGYAKPEAEAYEIAADRLGVRLDECIFTDDRADFCEAARGVGMQAIEFRSFEQFKPELEKLLQQGQNPQKSLQ